MPPGKQYLKLAAFLALAIVAILGDVISGYSHSSDYELKAFFPRFHLVVAWIAPHGRLASYVACLICVILAVCFIYENSRIRYCIKTGQYNLVSAYVTCIAYSKRVQIHTNFLAWAIIILITFYLVLGLSFPMIIGQDSFSGFQAMKSTFEGGEFNMVSAPDCNNIAKTHSYFLTYWTPGQYLFPALFYYAHIPLGIAITLVVFLCSAVGLVGYYFLYRQLGFPKLIAMLSLAVIATQMSFAIPFIQYAGGEVLLFGITPWIIWSALKNSQLTTPSLLTLFVLLLLGFICKNSVLITFFSLLLTLCTLTITRGNAADYTFRAFAINTLPQKKYFLKLALLSGIFLSAVYFTFMQYGENTVSELGGWQGLYWGDLVFPIAMPLTSCFSFDILLDYVTGTRLHDGLKVHPLTVFFYIPLASFSVWVTYKLTQKTKQYNYKIILLCFSAFYFLFFSGAYLLNTQTPMQSRNAVVLGYLFLPGILSWITDSKPQSLTVTMIAFFVLMNLLLTSYFIVRYQVCFKKDLGCGSQRIAYEYFDQETLNLLVSLDKLLTTGNNIFYLPAVEPTLEIKNNRVIANQDFLRRLELDEVEQVAEHYSGRVDNLLVFMPKEFETRDEGVLKLFNDYSDFETVAETKKYIVLKGK